VLYWRQYLMGGRRVSSSFQRNGRFSARKNHIIHPVAHHGTLGHFLK